MKRFLFAIFIAVSSLFALVDINSASKEELQSIKGIGEKKAEAIIEYRANKCFSDPSELVKVRGFGEKSVEKILSEITANPCEETKDKE